MKEDKINRIDSNGNRVNDKFCISIDTGGTFTDLVVSIGDKIIGLFKASTTPNDLFIGIKESLKLAAKYIDVNLNELLLNTDTFIYSTTRSTNAVLVGDIAKTSFITTKGFRDILFYKEGGRSEAHNLSAPFPLPYVPRRLTFELTERVLSDGTVAVPLDDEEVRDALRRMSELNIEAIGVCLIFSVSNPSHEIRVGELIREILPDVDFSLSHQVNGSVREYRRASSTVIDASIKPLMRDHLSNLESRLRRLGFCGKPLMVTHISGGVMSLEQMCERPIHTLDSGPALAPVAGLEYARIEPVTKGRDLIVVDTGGTSFDISLTHESNILYTREKWLGEKWTGHMTGLPAVDTRSFGAGGGSIAHLDAGGLLHVGPESAGAEPGPVCYGRGGTEPTLTDAALTLGYIDPENFLGGRMVLDARAARLAIETRIARPMGITVEEAAEGILRVASENMRGFVVDMTISQGKDPRKCAMVAGGGAAGLNIVRIARELGIETIIIPCMAGGLSAVGGQFTDISFTQSVGKYANSNNFDFDGVNEALSQLDDSIGRFLASVENPGKRSKSFFCEARYDRQIWEIDVAMGQRFQFEGPEDVTWLREEFDDSYLKLFTVNQPGTPIETITWRGEGKVVRRKPELQLTRPTARIFNERATAREAWFEGKPVATSVYREEDISVGTNIYGPAIIEEPTTTIVVDPGASVNVNSTHYLVQLEINKENKILYHD